MLGTKVCSHQDGASSGICWLAGGGVRAGGCWAQPVLLVQGPPQLYAEPPIRHGGLAKPSPSQ